MDFLKQEALRYLGYKSGQQPGLALNQKLGACMLAIAESASPAYAQLRLKKEEDGGALILGARRIDSRDLQTHLAGCEEYLLFAATLGAQVDRLIGRTGKISVADEAVMQACAAAYIEEYADSAHGELTRAYAQKGYAITRRFSPGYGDLALDTQGTLLKILDAHKKIGLCATAAHMLTPTKSITAVIGLSREALPEKRRQCGGKCAGCDLYTCAFRSC
ncbi:MAG: hypothetical protein LBS18_07675 [Clostridiales bacterium]|jgi:hypothetical protein|nr:hypothetical protein [Clostridiales bacterium]